MGVLMEGVGVVAWGCAHMCACGGCGRAYGEGLWRPGVGVLMEGVCVVACVLVEGVGVLVEGVGVLVEGGVCLVLVEGVVGVCLCGCGSRCTK